jgi:HK97 family phage portal protein
MTEWWGTVSRVGWFSRSIRPPDELPNGNDPATVAPGTVGPPTLTPGDPHGLTLDPLAAPPSSPPTITPSAWSGWPADWWPPNWGGQTARLTDTAWTCVDLNANLLSTMPPYIVDAAPSLDAGWLENPDPDLYGMGWEEFAKQLFWDYQLGEAFVLATARYQTGWPARFHVVPPWYVNVEMAGGRRVYSIGSVDVTADMLHLRYQGSVDDAHGHGPLEAGAGKVLAGEILGRYASNLASSGGIPSSVLEHPEQLTAVQAADLRAQWVTSRLENLGAPAVLSGGVSWKPTQMNPKDMALLELLTWNDSRIAVMLGVPPFLVGLPSGGDSLTYQNVTSLFDYHWRAGLRPKAQQVMAGLSGWLLPRGTTVEVNKDAYVQPEPLQRAQTAQIYNAIRDEVTGAPVMSVQQIQEAERLTNATPQGGPIG